MGKGRAHERELIGEFINSYNKYQPLSYRITDWPEDHTSGEIEALAEASGGRTLAIEHTIIETFAGRKLDDERFLRVFEPFERELKGAFDFDLTISVQVFALDRGQDWKQIHSAIQRWLVENAPTLKLGLTVASIPGVPFPVTLEKDPEPPGRVLVARNGRPTDNLVELITRGIDRKKDKLHRHHDGGHEAILLLESDDMALGYSTFYQAYLKAQAQTQHHIDQIWYVHSGAFKGESMSYWFWCYLGPEEIMESANPPNHMIGPKYTAYWARP